MNKARLSPRRGGSGAFLVCLFLMLSGSPVSAQNPEAPRPETAQTWADQQKAQAWATRKLDQSPRRHEWVTISNGGKTLKAFVTYPQTKGKAPVVLVPHEVFGLTDSTRNTADEIAAMGYIAIAPDMVSGFGPNGGGTGAFATSRQASTMITSLPDETVNAAFNAWADYGLKLPEANGKLAIVGLSWGGGAAFRYALSGTHSKNLKLVCVFYDVGPPAVTQGPNRDAKNNPPISVAAIDVPVYGFYGSTDARVMQSLPATKAEMEAAGKAYNPMVFEGADHAFMRVGEDPANRNPANPAAVKASLARLKMVLGGM
jgi:carboxymethylenebutenolidase